MPRYRLTIAYEGADFHGWQRQDAPDPDHPGRCKPLRTVQHVVEQAIRDVVRQPIQLQGASRTDAGVHAQAQTAAFTVPVINAPQSLNNAPPPTLVQQKNPTAPIKLPVWERLTNDRLRLAINSRLPGDVLITNLRIATNDFEPISDCLAKGYRYLICAGLDRPLWDRRCQHHIRTPLDLDLMQQAAALFVGTHDFAAYARAGHGRKTTVRTVFDCSVTQQIAPAPTDVDDESSQQSHPVDPLTQTPAQRFAIDISGNGFLHNMVRIVSGTIVEVGRGRMKRSQIERSLQSGLRTDAGPTLPPTGLTLMWMTYPDEPAIEPMAK